MRYRIRPYSIAWCIVGSAKLLMGIGMSISNNDYNELYNLALRKAKNWI